MKASMSTRDIFADLFAELDRVVGEQLMDTTKITIGLETLVVESLVRDGEGVAVGASGEPLVRIRAFSLLTNPCPLLSDETAESAS